MNKEHVKRYAVIFLLIAAFLIFDATIYFNFTYRYRDNSSEVMQEQTLELGRYLPFDDDSLIVKVDSSVKIKGELPVLDGATALFPVYSAFVNATYPKGSVEFDGMDFTAASTLQKTGTAKAYKAVVDGGADVIFAAEPSQGQIEYAERTGVELAYVPLGYEAFVFIVSAKNPVESLTAEQIRGIYSGVYKNWRDIGGDDSAIVPVQRVDGSGSQTALLSFMEGAPLITRPLNIIGRAIGYSFRLYVSELSGKENVKMLAVDGVHPTADNIRNGTYPVTDCFYAVYRTDNPNGNIPLLLDWALSDEGQDIIEKTGYVPVN
jgi:phosphate transport system substrate-binding protein